MGRSRYKEDYVEKRARRKEKIRQIFYDRLAEISLPREEVTINNAPRIAQGELPRLSGCYEYMLFRFVRDGWLTLNRVGPKVKYFSLSRGEIERWRDSKRN